MKYTDEIFTYRVNHHITGRLEEIENEKTIETLKAALRSCDGENKRLVEELTKYQKPEQPKGYQAHG